MTAEATTKNRDYMFGRLRRAGFNPEELTLEMYPQVASKLGWAKSTYRTVLAFAGRYNSRQAGQFGRTTREYLPSDRDIRVLKEKLGVFVSILQAFGCRYSQMWTLSIDDEHVLIPPCKGGKAVSHEVRSLPPSLVAEVKSWIVERSYTEPGAMRKRWNRLAEAGLIDKRCVPHSFRHALVTKAIASGIPIASVSKLVGHSSHDTTMAYHHVPARESAQLIGRLYN